METDEISAWTRMDLPVEAPPKKRARNRGVIEQQASSASSTSLSLLNSFNLDASLKENNGRENNGRVAASSRRADVHCRMPGTPHRTPGKSPMRGATPSSARGSVHTTPSKTPGKSPSRADRFIPSRNNIDFERGFHELLRSSEKQRASECLSPSQRAYRSLMSKTVNGSDSNGGGASRILSFNPATSKTPEKNRSNSNAQATSSCTGLEKRSIRHIPQVSERILDAPELQNDYYLNLLDWSSQNSLAVALDSQVFLWNAGTGDIEQLLQLNDRGLNAHSEGSYVSSVKFLPDGNILAVGINNGDIELWDVEELRRMVVLRGHTDRVGSLSWNQHILSSGCLNGRINHSDVRVANHLVATISAHAQEVCGLEWSPDGRYLASGGNDNLVKVWSSVAGQCYTHEEPKHTFTHHQAAVKALAWCPWQANVLATGGGTADQSIKLWNCNNGTMLSNTETKSQVCALLWSSEYRELVSSHGYPKNEVAIWKYPSMEKIGELQGHSDRVLHMALSPDGSTVVSGSADETLRLWKCFPIDSEKRKQQARREKTERSELMSRRTIR